MSSPRSVPPTLGERGTDALQASAAAQSSDGWSQGLEAGRGVGLGARGSEASALEVSTSQSGYAHASLPSPGGSRASLSSVTSSSPWPSDNAGAPSVLGTIRSDLHDRVSVQLASSANSGRERDHQKKHSSTQSVTTRMKTDAHGTGTSSTTALVQGTNSRLEAPQHRPPPSLIQYRQMHQQILRRTAHGVTG